MRWWRYSDACTGDFAAGVRSTSPYMVRQSLLRAGKEGSECGLTSAARTNTLAWIFRQQLLQCTE